MLITGYISVERVTWPMFIIETLAWLDIIYEIFAGEGVKLMPFERLIESVSAFADCHRWLGGIPSDILWVILVARHLKRSILSQPRRLVNKIALGVVIWAAAT